MMFCRTKGSNPRPSEYLADAKPTELPGPADKDNHKLKSIKKFYFQKGIYVLNVNALESLISVLHAKPIQKKENGVGYMSPVKRICVFEHSVMTDFNCACPAIQRVQGPGFLSEGSF